MSHSKELKTKTKSVCFICGVIREDENQKIGLFGVPKNELTSWQSIIPKLKRTSKLCEKHFDKSDVIKGITIYHDFHPAERWRLFHKAFPKHFLVKKDATASKVACTPLKQLFTGNNQNGSSDDSTSASSLPRKASSTSLTIQSPQRLEHSDNAIVSTRMNDPGVQNLPKTNSMSVSHQSGDIEQSMELTVVMADTSVHDLEQISSMSLPLQSNTIGPAADCLPKKGQRKVRITIPTNCVKCLSDIKGQCAQCQVKELKRLLKIKDRLLQNKVKQLKRLQAKSDIRHRKMKLKLIEARRKLNTSRNRLFRMKKYANEVATTIADVRTKWQTLEFL